MTALTVYTMALQLLGLKSTDLSDSNDCADLEQRAPDILNMLIIENHKLDRMLKNDATVQPVTIQSLNDILTAHDVICYTLYPYELASLLIGPEDSQYEDLHDRYLINKTLIMEMLPATRHSIEDCYGFYG